MDPKRWSRPVIYSDAKGRADREINSTGEAARVLSSRWPIESGRHYRRARRVFSEVLDGKRPPSEARKAFIDAAHEAKVPVREP